MWRPDTAGPTRLKLAVKCELGEVRPAARAVRGFLLQQGCSAVEISDCELAFVEACNNAIQHARGMARRKSVLIQGEVGETRIRLCVTDHTPGFDWPAEAALPAAHHESGRGLYLIRRIMDSAEYVRGGHANTLTLEKKRSERRDPPSKM